MEEIIEKLKDILASEGQTRVKAMDIAKALNIHPDTFNSMKFRNSIPYKQILNFLEQRKININYFFFGSSPKESLGSEEKYRILKLYKTNASLGKHCQASYGMFYRFITNPLSPLLTQWLISLSNQR
ncbi:MAG: hypothetical protein K2P14_01530 [Anaeroplasmataceae bacterium]|nr:hypothetical protein [Anaeroplasmataceae bacterium]